MWACRVHDLGSNPSRSAVILMPVTLKLDKGMIEKLMEWTDINVDSSKNLSGKELTFEVKDSDILIELHPKEKMVEICDFEGSFGIWFSITDDKIKKFKEIIKEMGP
jgi:hypothetical protein